METAKNLFIIFQAIVGIGFSVFMMWGMFKVKKSGDRIVKNANELTESFKQFTPMLQGMIAPPQHDEELHTLAQRYDVNGYPPADALDAEGKPMYIHGDGNMYYVPERIGERILPGFPTDERKEQ